MGNGEAAQKRAQSIGGIESGMVQRRRQGLGLSRHVHQPGLQDRAQRPTQSDGEHRQHDGPEMTYRQRVKRQGHREPDQKSACHRHQPAMRERRHDHQARHHAGAEHAKHQRHDGLLHLGD